jgi:hypothetical protein
MPAGDPVVAAAERVLALLDRLCAVSPVVLVVDDLQWADEVSMSVWHRLAGATGQVPLLVVGVSRPAPRPAGVVVARRGVVARGGVVVSVEPLGDAEVTVLVAGLVGGRPGPGLLGQAGRAGGNPLYVRELVDALVREDRVRVSDGGRRWRAVGMAGMAGVRCRWRRRSRTGWGSRRGGRWRCCGWRRCWGAVLGAGSGGGDAGASAGAGGGDQVRRWRRGWWWSRGWSWCSGTRPSRWARGLLAERLRGSVLRPGGCHAQIVLPSWCREDRHALAVRRHAPGSRCGRLRAP